MSSSKEILIIGGYGEAGKRIAEILLSQTECFITIAGRNEQKARACADALNRNEDGIRLQSKKMDMKTVDFYSVLQEFDLLIMAVPVPGQKVTKLIQALIKHQTHYIDLSPSPEKSKLFKVHQDSFRKANLCAILDAGADPGLPGLLGRLAARMHPSPEDLEVAATYRSDDIGPSGAEDILSSGASARFFKKGYWRKANSLAGKIFRFPDSFGKHLSLPLYLEEYREIPADFPLQQIKTYHTAYNLPANLVYLLFKLLGSKLLPLSTAGRWFSSALKSFTPKPFGIAVVAKVRGDNQQLQLQLWHYDLYQATAAPVALCARMLMEQELLKCGCFFMGEAVHPEKFVKELASFGFSHQFS